MSEQGMAGSGVGGWLRKAGGAGACGVCCALPMLIVLGVVSVGTALVWGVVAASIAAVVVTTVLAATGRLDHQRGVVRLALFAVGGAAAVAGLWGAATDRSRSYLLIAVAVTALAAAALMALADARPSDRRSV